MADVLFVSKPIAPPWNDSGKNLVHDLAAGITRHRPVLLTPKGSTLELPHVRVEEVYPARAGGFAPALIDNMRVMARLVMGRRADVWHFFFAPNPKSSAAARAALALRKTPSVHTVSSGPRDDEGARTMARLFFSDRVVVLSRFTEQRLAAAGFGAGRVVRIPPAIGPLEPLTEAARRAARARLGLPESAPVIVYPGDLEFGEGAELALDAVAALGRKDVWLVMACRAKTARAKEAERVLRERPSSKALEGRLAWLGETREIHALLGAADVVALPARSLYAKMDYPLVLLEAMSLERPVVVSAGTAADELAEGGAAAIASEASIEALSAALLGLLDDAAARRELGLRGRSAVLGKFSRATMAASYETLYDELLGRAAS